MQQNMVLQGFKIHERQRQMKEEVDKLTDYKAIKDYAVGWPEKKRLLLRESSQRNFKQ